MPKILTKTQYTNLQIPKIGAFRRIAEMLENDMRFLTEILGATLFGSYVTNQHQLSSNLNLAVFYKGDEARLSHQLKEIIEEARKTHVPLSVLALSEKDPYYHHSYYYRLSIRSMLHYYENKGGLLGDSVAQKIDSKMSLEDSIKHFLANRIRQLSIGMVFYKQLSAEGKSLLFSRMIGAAHTGARLMVSIRTKNKNSAHAFDAKELHEAFSEVAGTSPQYYFKQQQELLRRYNEMLKKKTGKGQTYDTFQRELYKALPNCLELLRYLLTRLD